VPVPKITPASFAPGSPSIFHQQRWYSSAGSRFWGLRGRQGKGAVFTLRKLEAQFSLQRLYLLREDGGWEM